jgi:hydroxypyruvate reductase 1
MAQADWTVHNADGRRRVIVTKGLPGTRWLDLLTGAGCRVEVSQSARVLGREELAVRIGERCDAVIGQLTEDWDAGLFDVLAAAAGRIYANYAVGYDNVDVDAATERGIAVANTPGVLTETTAEMAVALTFAVARRIVEADRYVREGRFESWLPTLFIGQRLCRRTVGVIGAGRIGSAYARMMVEGHKMDLVYYDIFRNEHLEQAVAAYSELLAARGEDPVSCRRADTVEEVLATADVVSLHTVLDDTTTHLIDAARLAMMKDNAMLVNTSRGPIIDEAALVDHCREHPHFLAGIDVFEHEPSLTPGIRDLDNIVVTPHIASASQWTRRGMATLAALNIIAVLHGLPVWRDDDVLPFLSDDPPDAAPSVVNATELGLD